MNLGLCGIVFIILLIMKLCGVIAISWLAVFVPLIIVAVVWMIVLIVVGICLLFAVIK